MNSRRTALVVFLLLLLLAGAAAAQSRSDGRILRDLQRKIPPSTGISISVANGVVTLTGTVTSCAIKDSILNRARRTIGVRSVVDRITVVPTQHLTDDEINRAVKRALLGNLSSSEISAINVSTQAGVVTLTGTLESSYPKQLAGVLASWIPGVVAVNNEITVKPSELRSDLNLEADINNRFRSNPFIADQKIIVRVYSGVVTLTGVVDSELASEQAEAIARFTPGVVEVRNQIYVSDTGAVT